MQIRNEPLTDAEVGKWLFGTVQHRVEILEKRNMLLAPPVTKEEDNEGN